MTSSISKVIDTDFIKMLQTLTKKHESSGSLMTSESSDAASFSTSLQYGAQLYVSAIQNVNATVSCINVADNALENLVKKAKEMLDLAKKASSSTLGKQTTQRYETQFRNLIKDFNEIKENAKWNGREVLDLEKLSEVFMIVGLPTDEKGTIRDVFEKFGNQESLADDEVRTPGVAAFSVFDRSLNLTDKKEAAKLAAGLEQFIENMDNNREILEESREVLSQNVDLLRGVGLSFIKVSQRITTYDEASDVARQLALAIRKNAPGTLSQIDHLRPITIATLLLDGTI